MIVLPLNPDDTPRCEQVTSGEAFSLECYDMTETQQLIQNIFAWPAGILGAITVAPPASTSRRPGAASTWPARPGSRPSCSG